LDNRKATILEGRIRIDNGAQEVECTVRDLSDTGAQILAPPSVDLPREFDLNIPKRAQSVRAQVVWSRGRSHGIAFVDEQLEAGRDVLPDIGPISAGGHVQDILADARRRLSQVIGLPVDSIRLRLEIDG